MQLLNCVDPQLASNVEYLLRRVLGRERPKGPVAVGHVLAGVYRTLCLKIAEHLDELLGYESDDSLESD